jgi:flagellar protein FlgJ
MTINHLSATDFNGLSDLKSVANKKPNEAIPQVAKQFEAIFLQSMLKSMRASTHFLESNNPFAGKSEQTFKDMLDTQYSTLISEGKGLGLAQLLTQQLSKSGEGVQPPVINTPVDSAGSDVSESIIPSIQSSFSAPLTSELPKISMKSSEEPQVLSSIDEFVQSIWPYARQAASVLGLDPKILVAQAALETGWGKFVSKDASGESSYNLFNIKSTDKAEPKVDVKTTEYIANTPIHTTASFKKYPSVLHSFNDYIALLQGNSRYETALANTQDPTRFVTEMHRAGYATDPKYASKILAIYHGDELNQSLERTGLSH